jgi:hypothetical protein
VHPAFLRQDDLSMTKAATLILQGSVAAFIGFSTEDP